MPHLHQRVIVHVCCYPYSADGGFDGLSAQGLRIITPTTKRDDPLYSAQSHFRILIEQRIGDLKDWRACKEQWRSPITEDSKEEHHRVYVVVAAILNLFNTRKKKPTHENK